MARLNIRLELWIDAELDDAITEQARELAGTASALRLRSEAARQLLAAGAKSKRRTTVRKEREQR